MMTLVVKKELINGRLMTCPRCKREHDILQYVCLETIQEYASETTPVYKCPTCKWLFAPAGEMPQELYAKFEERIENLLTQLEKGCNCKACQT